MRTRLLNTRVFVERPVEDVFGFFADASNLDRLTPAWLQFEILTPAPIHMRAGTRIDYRLRMHGIPIRWQSEITVWEPPVRFVDEQRRGPYSRWVHEHTFEARRGGTLVRDEVEYAVPGWLLEPVIDRALVRPDLDAIFAYRREQMLAEFGGPNHDRGPGEVNHE